MVESRKCPLVPGDPPVLPAVGDLGLTAHTREGGRAALTCVHGKLAPSYMHNCPDLGIYLCFLKKSLELSEVPEHIQHIQHIIQHII